MIFRLQPDSEASTTLPETSTGKSLCPKLDRWSRNPRIRDPEPWDEMFALICTIEALAIDFLRVLLKRNRWRQQQKEKLCDLVCEESRDDGS